PRDAPRPGPARGQPPAVAEAGHPGDQRRRGPLRHGGGRRRGRRGARGQPHRDRPRRAVVHGRHPAHPARRGPHPGAVRHPRQRRRRRPPDVGAGRRGAGDGDDRGRRAARHPRGHPAPGVVVDPGRGAATRGVEHRPAGPGRRRPAPRLPADTRGDRDDPAARAVRRAGDGMTTDAVVPGPADGTGDEPPPALGTDGAPAATAAPDAGVAEPEGAPVGVLAPGDGTTPATGPAPVSERRRHPRPTSRRGRAVARRAGRAGVAAWADGVAVAGGGPGDGGSERAPAPAEAGAVGSGAARRRAALTPERLRRRRALVLGAMAGLTLGGVALAVVGVTEVRTSTAGRYQEELGPDDPGYEAYVVPSPTLAVLHRGADGSLVGAALIALAPEDHGGSVVVVPTSAVVVREGGEATIAEVDRTEGAEAAASAVGQAVTAAAAEHVEVDDARWRDLVAPVGGLEVSIDAPVGEWEAGRVELRPEDVGAFLAARAEGESELERVERQLQFWNAWLPQVAAGGEDVLPGEVETGIGRFVRGVARGEGSAAALPVV